jgi:hypothetical protein
MKRATRERLECIASVGTAVINDECADDILDSDARQRAEIRRLRKAVEEAIRIGQGAICPHEERHRGGVIWEICDACGAQWADDRGGFKPDPSLAQLEAMWQSVFAPKRRARPRAVSAPVVRRPVSVPRRRKRE